MHTVTALIVLLLASGSTPPSTTPMQSKILVAHRGASSYAPEHTAAAYRLAIAQGADYVEQDLGVTRDGVLVCVHDDSLERTTNVADVFPERYTTDAQGRRRWYIADFTLAEIRQLDAGRWFGAEFAGERILTFDEAVALIGTSAGLYPELKTPQLYRDRGVDIVAIFAEAVRRLGVAGRLPNGRPRTIVQSFDEQAVRDLARVLPEVPRTFLLGGGPAVERWLATPESLREVAAFASDIGPAKGLVERNPAVVQWAHAAGLTVTPYTFRSGATGAYPDVTAEMRRFLYDFGVDAVFTDNPDLFPRGRF